jgi:hypothetical protein
MNIYLQGPTQLISGILQAEEVRRQFGPALSNLFLSREPVCHPAISCRINKLIFELKREIINNFKLNGR